MRQWSLLLLPALLLSACGGAGETQSESVVVEVPAPESAQASPTLQESAPEAAATTTATEGAFDPAKIPVTDKLTGTFPYIQLPNGYRFTNFGSDRGDGRVMDFDREYFMYHGVLTPMEGRTFRAVVRPDREAVQDKEFSRLEVQRNFDDLVARLGGVKVSDGSASMDQELDRIKQLDRQASDSNHLYSSQYTNNVHTYVIRKPDALVWIQLGMGGNDAKIAILETQDFQGGMSITPASDIQSSLDSDGKAVLYINFDVDKATLKSDGVQAVGEIAKVLRDDSGLRLSIEGHTDSSGDATHNKRLSLARATSVRSELVNAGIAAARLDVQGHGAERPLVPNDSDANMAKNRRVELVKA